MATRIESAYDEARTFYAELGVDTDAALQRLAAVPISLHCWQGDDVGGFEKSGDRARRRPRRHRQLSRQGPHARRAARRRRRRRSSLIPGRHRLNLHAFYGEFGGKTVDRDAIGARALRRLDRLGEGARHRPRLQPDLLLAPEGGRRLHAVASRRGDPPVLDRARHRLPPDRRGDGPGARHAVRHQRLDPRRHQGHAGRSRRPARAAGRVARRDLRRADRPGAQPRRGRGQAVRHRLRELRRRLARVLPRLRDVAARSCSASTPATFTRPRRSPTRSASVFMFLPRDPAARQPRRPLGQRPRRRCSPTSCEAIAPGARARRLPRPHPHRPRLLRRQHQPRRRVGHRHAQHAQGAAHGAARADRRRCAQLEADGDYTARLALLEENKTLPFGAVWDHYCETVERARRHGVAGGGSGSTRRTCCRAGNPLARQHSISH